MNLTERLKNRGYDLSAAADAIRAIVRNPDDLPQVFALIDALSGRTADRLARRLRATPEGRALLERGSHIAPLLRDREGLRRLPEGSLGRAYLAFVESENISAEGIEDASAKGRLKTHRTADEELVHQRLRDTHDLWHALTGYRGDVLGELALLAFTVPQTANPAIVALLAAAVAKGLLRGQYGLVVEGYRRGMAAAFLLAVEWERLLARPVDEVRRELRVGEPIAYTPLRTSELRAQGVLEAA